MPLYPKVAAPVAAIRGSVYSALAHRLATYDGEVYPLHVGDTWMRPADGCRMEDLRAQDHPGLNQYTHVRGLPALIEAIVERQRARTGLAVEAGDVLVTAGATSGLSNAVGAVVEPGDEVLILAPHWPLIDGIVRCFGAQPVPVPFFGIAESPQTAVRAVSGARTSRTVALYVNTPNNPTGRVIPREWMEALFAWARREDLWILSDEVYEDYLYRGEHTYGRPLAPERTLAAHSFSKAYGMAGYRCGYLVGPKAVLLEACKVSTHTIYTTPTPSQVAACRVLAGPGDAWVEHARKQYRATGERAAARLGVSPPEGSAFLFLDVAGRLGERGLLGFLEECADRGLLAAPGPSFGPYPTHIRICYTAAEPAVVERGVEVLARLLGR